LVLGFFVGGGATGRWLRRERTARALERQSADRALLKLRRTLEEFEERTRDHAELVQLLPDLVAQMFDARGPRGVYPVTLKLIEQIFEPAQAAIFAARPGRLALVVGRGLPPSLQPGSGPTLELARQGRLGYVAANRVAMNEDDFRDPKGELRTGGPSSGVALGPDDGAMRGLRVDAAAPIEDSEGMLRGVVCIGGVKNHLGEEKRLLTMVAKLTAVALTHVTRLRTVEELADVDGLTGVNNKRYFQARLQEELHKADPGTPLSLLLLDIDHFKHYNDTNGHLDGDDVLRRVGQLLKGVVREDDVVARYGGEEFVVVYPGTGKQDAIRLAEGIREAVAFHVFPHGNRQPSGALTISGGVATFPADARSAVELVRAADQALYDAKASGRNRVIPAHPNYLS
jgi:diguanylate cyclase (GGDEF)-like protein